MKLFKPILIALVLIANFSLVEAQNRNNKTQLAYQYFRDKEYSKAAMLYQELYEQSHSKTYLNYLVKCYIAEKHYDTAEKILKSEIRQSKHDPTLKVQLGSVYKLAGQEDKAVKLYEKSIHQLKGHRTSVITLANAFISNKEFEMAKQVYLKGRKLSKGQYSYAFELANVYYYSRNYPEMIRQYLDVLEEGSQHLRSVQNRLQATVYNQDDGSLNTLLKRELIARVQKEKQTTVFTELLIWLYIQENDFSKAFIQTRAIDKRMKEEGQRLLALGKLAYKNKDYATAIRCYEYVIDKGEGGVHYIEAKQANLQALKAEITQAVQPQKEQVQALLEAYDSFLSQNTNINQTALARMDYAHVLTFYAGQNDKGIAQLEDLVATPGLKLNTLYKARLELADHLLFNNDIWEATLYYSQVIKGNPNNELGNEAQLKKAKLAYYSGDFLWAKGLLDVLKASTSKLISNDAFYLSAIIGDNLQGDTLTEPLQLFASADLALFQNNKTKALSFLKQLAETYPSHSLYDDLMFKQAQIYASLGQIDTAKVLYRTVLDNYYSDILADNALMKLADLYWQEGQKEKASELYTQLLVDFPDSFFTTEARRRIVAYRDS